MDTGAIEQLFSEFRDAGDPAALGAVFDRSAPELYRVAAHLTRDAAVAEDLVQSSFLAAIETAGEWRSDSKLLPWLLGILLNQLRMQRRRSRQQIRQPRDGVRITEDSVAADASAVAQAKELEENLRRCLESLPESYRTPLVLHLEHDLTAAQIAVAIDRPAGTVRSQLSRGMELVRRLLPRGVTGLAAAAAMPSAACAEMRSALLTHVAGRVPGVTTLSGSSLFGGVFAMKTVVALAVLCVVGFAVYTWSQVGAVGDGVATRLADADSKRTDSPSSRVIDRAVDSQENLVEQRVAAEGGGRIRSGLRLEVSWHDGTVAKNVIVTARPEVRSRFGRGTEALHVRARRTDASGVAFFESLVGSVRVLCPRGGKEVIVSVLPEGVTSTVIAIPAGFDVRGVVVDADENPLRGADVLVGHYLNMRRITRTDDTGRFSIRSAGESRWIGALAEGYASGPTLSIEKHGGRELTLRMGRVAKGIIEGRVVDDRSAPIPDALVVLGPVSFVVGRKSANKRDDGKGLPIPPMDRTDADGRFRISGIDCFYEDRLAVGAANYAVRVQKVRPRPDRVVRIDVRLERGVVLSGTVRKPSGEPQPNAGIQVRTRNSPPPRIGDQGPAWSRPSTRSDAEGRYRIDYLPAGDLAVSVRTRNPSRVAYRSFSGRPGEEISWDPIPSSDLTIRGKLQRADGTPIVGWQVSPVTPEGAPQPRDGVTAADGSFEIKPCVNVMHELRCRPGSGVWRSSVLTRTGVTPGGEPVDLVVSKSALPSGFLMGRIVDADGESLQNVQVHAQTRRRERGRIEASTGKPFELGPLPPGSYKLIANHPERGECSTGYFEVASEERVDVGEIRFAPPGRVRVLALERSGKPVGRAGFYLVLDGGVFGSRLEITQGQGKSLPLAPGRYFLRTGTMVFDVRPFVVESGRTTELRIREVRAFKRKFRFLYGGLTLPVNCTALWKTHSGEDLGQTGLHLWQKQESVDIEFAFPVGSYRLVLTLPSEREVRQAFEVTSQEGQKPVIVRLNGGR